MRESYNSCDIRASSRLITNSINNSSSANLIERNKHLINKNKNSMSKSFINSDNNLTIDQDLNPHIEAETLTKNNRTPMNDPTVSKFTKDNDVSFCNIDNSLNFNNNTVKSNRHSRTPIDNEVKWQIPKPVIRTGFRGFMLKKYTNEPTKEYLKKKDIFFNDMIRKNA